MRLIDRGLRFHDPRTGQELRSWTESEEARQHAESRLAEETAAREREAAAREAAEARVEELERRLRQAGLGSQGI